jgi:arginyl-tRNA synthetase
VYLALEESLRHAVAAFVAAHWPDAAPEGPEALAAALVVERPPKAELGDFALPLCFDLARRLRRPPRALAQEIASGLALPTGLARAEAAGGGYLNAFVDRAWLFAQAAAGQRDPGLRPALGGKAIVEHTNINPNKAAHIGHLRNAVLGDTFARLLRFRGETVEVQNYIDNTGVQVADVAVGLERLEAGETPGALATKIQVYEVERRTLADEGAISPAPHFLPLIPGRHRAAYSFDYFCWDLYSRVSRRYAEEPASVQWRAAALAAIEQAEEGRSPNPTAEIAALVAGAIVTAHLRTMRRLHIAYDLLPRESEILRLHFWREAFEQMKARGAIRLEAAGKNTGCWVMDWRQGESAEAAGADVDAAPDAGGDAGSAAPGDAAKVIVRSNGTVTYVGKDIAYQLWKFGLLGRDFQYRRRQPVDGQTSPWITTAEDGDANHPPFGRARWVFNVIDTRQSYLQEVVQAGLRALGYADEAGRSVHFSYEMVALTPRCARELGYELSPEEERKSHVEVSGRKGLGVKADDLLDRLLRGAWAEVAKRHPELDGAGQLALAGPIATGAARYFLLKFTRNALIAFDFEDALSFDGETGPYVQYAAVRAASILRKAEAAGVQPDPAAGGELLAATDVWDLLSLAARLEATVHQALAAGEPAYVAKYAFQLAQAFNNFYHRRPVLAEEDAGRRAALLALVAVTQRQLAQALELLGITAPEIM